MRTLFCSTINATRPTSEGVKTISTASRTHYRDLLAEAGEVLEQADENNRERHDHRRDDVEAQLPPGDQ